MTWRTVYIYIYHKYLFFIGKNFAPALSYKVLLFYSPSVKKMLFATVRLTLRPGVTQQMFIRGGSALRSDRLLFYVPFFPKKGTPFIHLLLTNGTPLTDLI